MAIVSYVLLWLACVAANVTATRSGTLELDLMFPRNGTWKPTNLMPIIFAVQQLQLGDLVQRQLIRWRLAQRDNTTLDSIRTGAATIELNSTTPGLYLATGFSDALAGIEGEWIFQWQVSLRNCSELNDRNTLLQFSVSSETRWAYFRTNESAPTLNFETAISPDSCRDVENIAFNVTAIQSIPRGIDPEASPSCAALGAPPKVTGSPCAVTINAAASMSASAAVSYSACQATATACAPPSSTRPSAATSLRNNWIVLWVAVTLLGFIYI
jgi:hypothetical protein